ncbi:MAG: phage baseplate assembly protein V [Sphingomonas sp.]|jgi:phage baseplate assembly protein V|uniref:phage baseplate assembly protein V n=1 Tax=Sphingomonas TaxID=13687 RepID=UPI0003690562|nr:MULTISPECIES: phage baseplate assembly protein V [Sphingomonas]MCP4027805.1 phage baseplate assembly protein V [Sphingomonas sp.]
MAQPADLQRLLGDLAREGVIVSVDRSAGTARVEFAEGLTTGNIPWLSPRAGKTRIWSPPSVGECVLVLAPEADATRGIIVGSLSSSAHPHPAQDGSTLAEFEDGATISYDPESHALMAYLPDDATVIVVARGGLHFTGDVTVDGNIHSTGTITGDADVVGAGKSLKGHLHKNVQPGGGISGPPQ